MTKDNYLKALEIISQSHSTEIKINLPTNGFVGDSLGVSEFNLTITRGCVSVVDRLTKSGYALSMTKDGLSVDKY